MSPQVEVQPLSRNKRRFVFLFSLLLFVLTVPASVFYATGYRFDFSDKIHSIKRVGGLYVRNDLDNTEIIVNEKPVDDMRVFQRAAYIQNLSAGMHRLHVQGEGVQTWSKQLPVYAHLVTEVTSFNLPSVSQVRVVTQWLDQVSNVGIVFDDATTTILKDVHVTNALLFSSTTATTTFSSNSEYTYIQSLFASSSQSQQELAKTKQVAPIKKLTFDVATSAAKLQSATTTKIAGSVKLSQKGEDVFAQWQGSGSSIPYYYCLQYQGEEATVSAYGEHVLLSLQSQFATSSDLELQKGERVCRDTIRIDRLRQQVSWFDFYPDSTDLVLMLLEDGLYVVEIDDRGWQNTQSLYKGKDLHVVVDGGRIFVEDGDLILEVLTNVVVGS